MNENANLMIPCPNCKNQIDPNVFYCPICGKKIKEPPVSTGFWPILGLFLFCILLPPLNIPLSFKYLRAADTKAKTLGWISLFVMAAALAVITVITINVVNEVNRQVEVEMGKYLGF